MAREAGAEDHVKLENNEWRIVLDDAAKIIVRADGIQTVVPVVSSSMSVRVLSASVSQATLTAGQHFVVADATAANFGIVLPNASASVGQTYTVKKIDASANLVFMSGATPNTIDGAAFATLASQNGSLSVTSDGVHWRITSRFSGALSA
jgi:hypothetical protein